MNLSRAAFAAQTKLIECFAMHSGMAARIGRIVAWKVLSFVVLMSATALGQSPQEVQETWQGLVISSDIHGSYSLTIFGVGQLESPRMFRDSDYFAGVRISHPVSENSRFGIEYVQDRHISTIRLFS